MALTQQQLVQCRRQFVETTTLPAKCSKAELEAAATAIDSWCTTNQASFLAALPEPFKSNTTASEKAIMLAYVAVRRYGG